MARTKTKGSTPLVMGDVTWADTVPEWLINEVKTERTVSGLAGLMGKEVPLVGDAEVCVYLMTASLAAPLDSEHTNIFQYVMTKVMDKKGKKMPEDIKKTELSEYEMGLLLELRYKIYTRRGGEVRNPLLDAMRGLKKNIATERR